MIYLLQVLYAHVTVLVFFAPLSCQDKIEALRQQMIARQTERIANLVRASTCCVRVCLFVCTRACVNTGCDHAAMLRPGLLLVSLPQAPDQVALYALLDEFNTTLPENLIDALVDWKRSA